MNKRQYFTGSYETTKRPSYWTWDRPVMRRDIPLSIFYTLLCLGVIVPPMAVGFQLPIAFMFAVSFLACGWVAPLQLWLKYRREQKAIQKALSAKLASLRVYGQ